MIKRKNERMDRDIEKEMSEKYDTKVLKFINYTIQKDDFFNKEIKEQHEIAHNFIKGEKE